MALPPTPRRVPAGCPPPVTHSREARSQRGGRRAKGRGRGAGLRAARLCAAGDGLLSAAGGGTGPPRDRCCPGVPWDHDEERRHAVISPYPHLNKPFWRASGSCGAGGEVGAPTGLRRSAVGDRARGAAGRMWGRCGEGGGAIGEGGGAYRERGGMPVVGGAYSGGVARGGRGLQRGGGASGGRGSDAARRSRNGAAPDRAVPGALPALHRAAAPAPRPRHHRWRRRSGQNRDRQWSGAARLGSALGGGRWRGSRGRGAERRCPRSTSCSWSRSGGG